MAAILIDNKRTTTLEFAAPDHAVVTTTGEIAVDGDCIFSTDGDVQVLGQVHTTGSAGTAIHFTKGRVKVEASGLVSGHSNGVLLDTSSSVYNLGTIASAGRAIAGTQNLYIETSGTIDGGEIGIEVFDSGATASTLTITNAGTIRGGSFAIRGAGGSDYVHNVARIEGGISFNGGDDSYQGSAGTVTGVIDLGEGNDQAFGGRGNEIFYGAGGDDTIFGGQGVDTVIYTGGADLQINLGTTARQNTGQGWDTLRDIENLWSGNGNDVIAGSAYANTLSGNGGNDRIYGQEGNDVLNGGLGSDLLDGSIGTDTALFAEGSLGATVNLALTGAQDTGMGTDTLKSIENLTGGSGDDKFTGDGASNVFTGSGGNDTLAGGGGADTATFSGARSDYLITKANGTVTVKDLRAGHDGTDTLTDIAFAQFGDGVTMDLRNKAPDSFRLEGSEIAENTQVGAMVAKLTASDPDGDALTYSLEGDTGGFFKIEGDQLILVKALDYETGSTHGFAVKVTDEYGASKTWDVTVNVRDIDETGPSGPGPTGPASLILYGTPRADALTGGGGNDAMWGLSGNDRLRGEAGNDRLCGGKGKDTMWGGSGLDIFVFDSKPNKKTNLDKIVDFNVADDTIHLARSIFSKIGKKGVLKKSAFHVGGDAHDANDRVIYNKKTGALFYDRDGNGDAAQTKIATLSKYLKAMSNGDFLIT